MNDYIITTERLGLRKWLEKDIEPFVEMNRSEAVMKYFPSILTRTETLELLQRIDLHFQKNNFGLFAVEEKQTKQFIGFTGFAIPAFSSFFTPCIEIGWRYRKECWGKGFATEAASACLKYGFDTLQFSRIVSFTSAVNLASEKLMQRIGMIKAGEFDHPKIAAVSSLCRHVLYEIYNPVN